MDKNSFPTYRCLDNYTQQEWHILVETFENLKNDSASREVINAFGEEGLYDQLSYHQKLIQTACRIGSFSIILDYLSARYRLFIARGIDTQYLRIETNYWCDALRHFLFQPYATEFITLYNQILTYHDSLSKSDTSYVLRDSLVDQLTKALIVGDETKAREIFNSHIDDFDSPLGFLEHVVKPSMVSIGIAWERAYINVAKEHVATAIIERIWEKFASALEQHSETKHSVLILIPESQLHKLGSKIIATLMESKGWKTIEMTLNKNNTELYRAIDIFHPNLIICSAMLPIHIPLIQDFVTALKTATPIYKGKIAVGGEAFYRVNPPVLLKDVDFQSSSLMELEHYIDMV